MNDIRKELKKSTKELLKDVTRISHRDKGCYVVNFVMWVLEFRAHLETVGVLEHEQER